MLPLLSIASNQRIQTEVRKVGKRAQISIIAERGLLMEAQVLEVLIEQMLSSNRPVVPVADITTGMIRRYGSEYSVPISNRWIGSILRKKLNFQTYKSHGVYVVPMAERKKAEMLCQRYGVSVTMDTASTEAGDLGTSGTS